MTDQKPGTTEKGASGAARDGKKTAPQSGSPQERTKNPQDHAPKWPGGGKKGEDEKR